MCYLPLPHSQDSRIPEVADLLGFDLVRPIVTVHSFLAERGPKALELLNDPLLPAATKTITSEGRPRYVIDADIKVRLQKEVG